MAGPSSAPEFEMEVVGRPPVDARPQVSPNRTAAYEGETLLKALQRADAPILSVCGGQASCGACRVAIEADGFARLPPAGPVEAMLLDYLDDPHPRHRLACQIVMTSALGGLRLTIAPAP